MQAPSTPPVEPETCYRLGDLARLRQQITDAGQAAGLGADRAAHLTLAVNEVVSNAIRHATGSALVAISRADHRLIVEVSDDGPGIPATMMEDRPQPSFDALNGRGLWLVRQFCDEVHIQTNHEGTQVRLVMLLTTEHPLPFS